MHTVFVYGTLMRGDRNAHFLSGSVFLGRVRTAEPVFHLKAVYDRDTDYPYPAALFGGACYLLGEVYEIDDATLARLDDLEAAGEDFERRRVRLENGRDAFIYIFISRVLEIHDHHERIGFDVKTQSRFWMSGESSLARVS